MKSIAIAAALLIPIAAAGLAAQAGGHAVTDPVASLTDLRTMTARFAPADIGADISALPDRERKARCLGSKKFYSFAPSWRRQLECHTVPFVRPYAGS